MSSAQDNAVIVGGGWAGLAAAVELSHAGVPVTLVESARQLGGRARCVRFGTERVDNGQHIMIGAYHDLLQLLQRIGIDEARVLRRLPLSLELLEPQGPGFHLRTAGLPAPLHLVTALLRATGLSTRERLAAVRFGRSLSSLAASLREDISVQALLMGSRQPARLVQCLWQPLCLAALNTPIQTASARIFLRVLQEAFAPPRENSDLLLPVTDLGSALPEPALQFIEARGGKVLLSRRVTGIDISDGAVRGVRMGDETLTTGRVVLAVNPVMCRRLLSPHPAFADTVRDLGLLDHQPITTLYLRYARDVHLHRPMLGLLQGMGQWVFDRGLCGQPGCIAVVISAEGEHMHLDNEPLVRAVTEELAALFPHWPAPEESLVIREKRATFASNVDVDRLRPASETAVEGCWLAGDYTDTGLPGTLESAVRSGRTCARGILASSGR